MRQQARQELARRRLGAFCSYVKPGFINGRPQQILCDALERVESGEIKRLMISMPPRHGKSLIATQLFPCWYLGRHPEHDIIQTTYAHPLSVEHSRLARKVFTSEEYSQVFPSTQYAPGKESQQAIAIQRQAADQWGTIQGGNYFAVGVGGGVTGRGAHCAIADDLIKNREEANSPTIREKVWDFWKSTLYTRLAPDGSLILVMTRWHPDDPAGRVLAQIAAGDSEPWTVINMPAWDETETEALWPERWPVEQLQRIRAAIGTYEWNSLYMGRPVIRGGNHFKVDRIVYHNDDAQFPKGGYVRAWDLASTQKERESDSPDYTAGACLALTTDSNGNEHIWLRDVRAGQWSAIARDNGIVQAARDDGDQVHICIEAVGAYKDTVANIKHRLTNERLTRSVKAIFGKELAGDKVSRSTPVEAIIENGCFHVLRDFPALDLTIKQMTEFPNGDHDDIPDSIALAYGEAKRRMRAPASNDIRSRLRI